jgi:hypothetical protein
MNIKLKDLQNSQIALVDLATKQPLAVTAFKVARVLRTVGLAQEQGLWRIAPGGELDLIEKQRQTLLDKYQAKADEAIGRYSFPSPEEETAFGKEYDELLETSIDLPITPLLISDLADLKISPVTLLSLDWLISEKKSNAPTPSS